jgi:CheY-like chemotaxis protein
MRQQQLEFAMEQGRFEDEGWRERKHGTRFWVHILVVDDELDARELIQRVLEDRRATVTTATSPDEALVLLQTRQPDVLLSDIGMPGMDGYELMRRIRASEAKRRRIGAAALTAFARTEDRKKAILAGC